MIRLFAVLPAALLVLLSACCSTSAGLSPEDVSAHRAMSQEFLDRVHAKDWKGLSEMYEEGAVVMQMYEPALEGRQAIHDFWAAFPPIKELRFVDDGIYGQGELAYVYGRYWLTFDLPGSPTDEGKYLDVRRRQPDGTWKYVSEAANTSLPRPSEN